MIPEDTTMTIWEKNIFGVPIYDLPKLIPGLLATLALAWASIFMSEFIGKQILGFEKSPVSPVMLAIILGLLIGVMTRKPKIFTHGIKFSVKKVLRLGIILLGIRLSIFDVLKLGVFGVPIVILGIVGALIITTWVNNKLKLPERLGTLIAVGTSICGVTAIVAASPAIGAEEEEAAYAVAIITVFGLFATLAYPYLASIIFAGDAIQVGLFLGTSIHETAQVVGAGQIYADIYSQPNALDAAIITKLVRNVFMAVVIPFMAFYYARKAYQGSLKGEKTSFAVLFPVFILGFLTMAVLRSLGDAGINAGGLSFGILETAIWSDVIAVIKRWAEICLVVALAGVGLSTDFRSFKALGVKPFAVGLCASAVVGGISFLTIKLLGNFVVF